MNRETPQPDRKLPSEGKCNAQKTGGCTDRTLWRDVEQALTPTTLLLCPVILLISPSFSQVLLSQIVFRFKMIREGFVVGKRQPFDLEALAGE